MTRRHRLAQSAWLVPAAVFALSGLLKIVAPDGTPPRLVLPLTQFLAYPWWLRLLGAGEVLLAAAVAWPRTRRPALATTAITLVTFSLFVGWNAADLAFVGNCGCFGGLGTGSRYYGWLVLRNAGGGAGCRVGLAGPGSPPPRRRSGRGGQRRVAARPDR